MKIIRSRKFTTQSQSGFTLVELLIATLVFTTILVVITSGIISFTKHYYQGVTASNTQNVTTAALDTISQMIQFSGDQIDNSVAGVVCIGNQQFTYNLGKQLEITAATSDQSTWSLYQTTAATPTCTPTHTGGRELLSPHMRLADFSICSLGGATCASPSPTNSWVLKMRVVSGDIDLLCAPTTVPGSCSPGAPVLTAASIAGQTPDLTCLSQAGSQFCAISGLSTVIQKRVGSGL